MGDRKLLKKLKIKINSIAIRPGLNSSETTAIRNVEARALERMEMKMLRWIGEISLKEKRNEDIHKFIGIENITEKCKQERLRWLGNVLRNEKDSERFL